MTETATKRVTFSVPKTKRETSAESLQWLVESRNKVQELMLRLDQHPNKPDGKRWQSYVGAAFSLWRAVFLCHDGNELNERLEPNAKKFLRRVIIRNTIGFNDDMDARAWTGGYYINNALFRLGLRTTARPKHASQRERWEDAYAFLNAHVPALRPSKSGLQNYGKPSS